MMGPLCHLLAESERLQAVKEARRVLRRDGVIFAAFITRFALLRCSARDDPEWVAEPREYVGRLLKTGVHDRTDRFTSAYLAHPGEIVPSMYGAADHLLYIGRKS